jgi:hypothetical protein
MPRGRNWRACSRCGRWGARARAKVAPGAAARPAREARRAAARRPRAVPPAQSSGSSWDGGRRRRGRGVAESTRRANGRSGGAAALPDPGGSPAPSAWVPLSSTAGPGRVRIRPSACGVILHPSWSSWSSPSAPSAPLRSWASPDNRPPSRARAARAPPAAAAAGGAPSARWPPARRNRSRSRRGRAVSVAAWPRCSRRRRGCGFAAGGRACARAAPYGSSTCSCRLLVPAQGHDPLRWASSRGG